MNDATAKQHAGPVNGSPLLAARICHDDGQTARR